MAHTLNITEVLRAINNAQPAKIIPAGRAGLHEYMYLNVNEFEHDKLREESYRALQILNM